MHEAHPETYHGHNIEDHEVKTAPVSGLGCHPFLKKRGKKSVVHKRWKTLLLTTCQQT